MTQMLFYQDVVPLSPETHAGWTFRQSKEYAFAAASNSVPLLLPEIPDAARELPVVFVHTPSGEFVLTALLGLRDNENLWLDADHHWEGRYVPAFVRRYPFVLSETPDGQYAVCVDAAASSRVGAEAGGEPLFADGKPTEQARQIVQFLETFRVQAKETADWCQRLADLELFEESTADARLNDGQRFVLKGIHVISEARLHKLPAAEIQSLFERGDLARIHAHLLSLGHLGKLIDRLAARQAAIETSVAPASS